MKKLSIITLLCVNFIASGQNSYGKHSYAHSGSECSSGINCVNNPGFLIAGYVPATSPGQSNFYLDRTDKNGVFTGAPYEFQNRYMISGSSNCASAVMPLSRCYGISAIEQVSNGSNYVVVGAAKHGAFFVSLNNVGNPLTQAMYPFPVSNPSKVTRPVVTESLVFPNEFYITGSFDGQMYILRVNNTGNLQAAYTANNSYSLFPEAIVESPYGNKDVTITGIKDNGSDLDGFFYQIDNSLTSFTGGFYYNFFLGFLGNSTLNSMTPAYPGNTNSGFLVGGWSDALATGEAWMMKVDPTGVPIWQTGIEGNFTANTSSVMAVAERYSVANNVYECYGAANTPVGIVVYKLDDTGTPMSTSFGVNDEFVFNDGTSSNTRPVAMSLYNNGASWDEGLHVYGNLNTTAGDHYLVQSYFSGEGGCNNPISTINTVYTQTISWCTLSDSSGTPLNVCFDFSVQAVPDTNYAVVCTPVSSYPTPATNARPMATGIAERTKEEFVLFPNPTAGIVILKGSWSRNSTVTVTDLAGREITVPCSRADDGSFTLNFSRTSCANGIYTIFVKDEQKSFWKKVGVRR